jgi:hypothetical protein
MKAIKSLLIIAALILVTSQGIFSQDVKGEGDYRFTVKTNPLSALGGPFWVVVVPITGEYKALFEAAIGDKSSVQFGAGYIGPSLILNLDELSAEGGEVTGIKTSGVRVNGMFKHFISRDLKAPEGFYVGPHVSYATATLKSKDNSDDKIGATKLNINAVIGYQMITSGGFTLDIFTGMGFASKKWEISSATSEFDTELFKDKSSVGIPFGVTFGYAF